MGTSLRLTRSHPQHSTNIQTTSTMASEGKTFSNDHEFASEQGQKGGATQPEEVYKPSEHDGLRKDGQPDKRMSSEHGFGGDRERASEMGKKGGVQGNNDEE